MKDKEPCFSRFFGLKNMEFLLDLAKKSSSWTSSPHGILPSLSSICSDRQLCLADLLQFAMGNFPNCGHLLFKASAWVVRKSLLASLCTSNKRNLEQSAAIRASQKSSSSNVMSGLTSKLVILTYMSCHYCSLGDSMLDIARGAKSSQRQVQPEFAVQHWQYPDVIACCISLETSGIVSHSHIYGCEAASMATSNSPVEAVSPSCPLKKCHCPRFELTRSYPGCDHMIDCCMHWLCRGACRLASCRRRTWQCCPGAVRQALPVVSHFSDIFAPPWHMPIRNAM